MSPTRLTRRTLPLLTLTTGVVALGVVALGAAPDLRDLWRLVQHQPARRIAAMRSMESRRPPWTRSALLDRAIEDDDPRVRAHASLTLLRLAGGQLDDESYRAVAGTVDDIVATAPRKRAAGLLG